LRYHYMGKLVIEHLYKEYEKDKIVIRDKHVESPAHVRRDVVFIESMAVDSDFRGKGIGHQFFEKVKELKTVSGSDGIELQVNAKNTAAYEMYKKYGEYYGAAEPPVRGGASHLSGQTEPPKNHFPSEMDLIP